MKWSERASMAMPPELEKHQGRFTPASPVFASKDRLPSNGAQL